MTYEKAQKNIVKRYTVADGYNGARAEFGLALVDGTAYEVHTFGCFPARMVPWSFIFSSAAEMIAAADAFYLYEPAEG